MTRSAQATGRSRVALLVVACASLGGSILPAIPAAAHEVRPAYLQLRESTSGTFDVLWKTPARGELRLALHPRFSGRTENVTPVVTRPTGSASIQTWTMRPLDPVAGQTIEIEGLRSTLTDALVRIDFADGSAWTQRLTPSSPAATVPERQSMAAVAGQYMFLGVEHILNGVDHLLFVLTLLLITGGGWKLVATVSAFTVSHTVTLGAATLGYVHVPQAPVEAIIAASIVFVAAEILRADQGHLGIAARAPWLVAFTFGLLHGLGFAGGLSEIVLPPAHIPTALLFFSIGVEIGHLLFVAAVLLFLAVARRSPWTWPRWSAAVPTYAIGSIAMFWVVQRVSVF